MPPMMEEGNVLYRIASRQRHRRDELLKRGNAHEGNRLTANGSYSSDKYEAVNILRTLETQMNVNGL